MRDLGLPNPLILLVIPPIDVDIPPANHDKALTLLNEYIDLFSTSAHDFRLLKGESHHLDLDRSHPF